MQLTCKTLDAGATGCSHHRLLLYVYLSVLSCFPPVPPRFTPLGPMFAGPSASPCCLCLPLAWLWLRPLCL